MMLITNYKGSRPLGFRQEDFSVFPILAHVKRDPRAGPF